MLILVYQGCNPNQAHHCFVAFGLEFDPYDATCGSFSPHVVPCVTEYEAQFREPLLLPCFNIQRLYKKVRRE